MSKYVVGLTGGIACGKTNLTDALKKAGAHVVDADDISRSLTAKDGAALPKIREAFGPGVFHPDGTLDRKALGALIFSSPSHRETLNAITHPMILAICQQEVDASPLPVVILSAPLLYERGMDKMCHEIWCAYVPMDEQLHRIMQRDNVSMDMALKKAQSQMPAYQKAARADRMIDTSSSREASAQRVLALYQQLLSSRNGA